MSHFWYICHVCAWRTFARMLGKYRIIHRMRSHFSSVWRTCFTIPCCVSLFVINPFSIFKSENVFNFPFPERYLCCIWNFMLTIIEGEIRPCFKDICDLVPRTCGHLDFGVKWTVWLWFSSVQFSHSVMSDSLRPHEPQNAWPPCPSPTPRVHTNLCPLNRWCHPNISSSVIPFSSCPQSFRASGSFPMSQLFASGGQSTWVSASTSVLPMNTQDWSPLGWTGWISFQSKGLSRVFSNVTVQKH